MYPTSSNVITHRISESRTFSGGLAEDAGCGKAGVGGLSNLLPWLGESRLGKNSRAKRSADD